MHNSIVTWMLGSMQSTTWLTWLSTSLTLLGYPLYLQLNFLYFIALISSILCSCFFMHHKVRKWIYLFPQCLSITSQYRCNYFILIFFHIFIYMYCHLHFFIFQSSTEMAIPSDPIFRQCTTNWIESLYLYKFFPGLVEYTPKGVCYIML